MDFYFRFTKARAAGGDAATILAAGDKALADDTATSGDLPTTVGAALLQYAHKLADVGDYDREHTFIEALRGPLVTSVIGISIEGFTYGTLNEAQRTKAPMGISFWLNSESISGLERLATDLFYNRNTTMRLTGLGAPVIAAAIAGNNTVNSGNGTSSGSTAASSANIGAASTTAPMSVGVPSNDGLSGRDRLSSTDAERLRLANASPTPAMTTTEALGGCYAQRILDRVALHLDVPTDEDGTPLLELHSVDTPHTESLTGNAAADVALGRRIATPLSFGGARSFNTMGGDLGFRERFTLTREDLNSKTALSKVLRLLADTMTARRTAPMASHASASRSVLASAANSARLNEGILPVTAGADSSNSAFSSGTGTVSVTPLAATAIGGQTERATFRPSAAVSGPAINSGLAAGSYTSRSSSSNSAASSSAGASSGSRGLQSVTMTTEWAAAAAMVTAPTSDSSRSTALSTITRGVALREATFAPVLAVAEGDESQLFHGAVRANFSINTPLLPTVSIPAVGFMLQRASGASNHMGALFLPQLSLGKSVTWYAPAVEGAWLSDLPGSVQVLLDLLNDDARGKGFAVSSANTDEDMLVKGSSIATDLVLDGGAMVGEMINGVLEGVSVLDVSLKHGLNLTLNLPLDSPLATGIKDVVLGVGIGIPAGYSTVQIYDAASAMNAIDRFFFSLDEADSAAANNGSASSTARVTVLNTGDSGAHSVSRLPDAVPVAHSNPLVALRSLATANNVTTSSNQNFNALDALLTVLPASSRTTVLEALPQNLRSASARAAYPEFVPSAAALEALSEQRAAARAASTTTVPATRASPNAVLSASARSGRMSTLAATTNSTKSKSAITLSSGKGMALSPLVGVSLPNITLHKGVNDWLLGVHVRTDGEATDFLKDFMMGSDVSLGLTAAVESPYGDAVVPPLRIDLAGRNYFGEVIRDVELWIKLKAINPFRESCALQVLGRAMLGEFPVVGGTVHNVSFDIYMHDPIGVPFFYGPLKTPKFVARADLIRSREAPQTVLQMLGITSGGGTWEEQAGAEEVQISLTLSNFEVCTRMSAMLLRSSMMVDVKNLRAAVTVGNQGVDAMFDLNNLIVPMPLSF